MRRSIVVRVLVVVLVGCVIFCSGCVRRDKVKKRNHTLDTTRQEETTEDMTDDSDTEIVAVITEIAQKDSRITFRELQNPSNQYTLTYSGSTSIKNKYGSQVLLDSFIEGDIVKINYVKGKQKLVSMEVPSDAWKNDSVTKWHVDEENKSFIIGTEKYKFDDKLYVNDKKSEIKLDELTDVDTLQVCGIGDFIYTVTILNGHGYLKLSDTKEFIGGMVDLNGKYLTSITEDMVMVVPEGEYNLNIWVDGRSSSTVVNVKENEETRVSLSQFQGEIKLNGALNLNVLPEGVNYNLYIDNVLVEEDGVLDLSYGKHWLVITSDKYTDYSEYINIGSIYTNKTIDLSLSAEIEKTETTKDTSEDETETEEEKTEPVTEKETTHKDSEDDNVVKVTMEVKEPEGASLYIDSKLVGVIPCQITQTVGKHNIVLRQSGYESVAYNVAFSTDDDGATLRFSDMTESTTVETK